MPIRPILVASNLLPSSAPFGEFYATTDTQALYVGQGGNLPLLSIGGGEVSDGLPIVGTPNALNGVTAMNAFGDSITIGGGVQLLNQCYPYLVASALGISVSNNYAVGGENTQQIVAQAQGTTPSRAVCSITLLGANNILTNNSVSARIASEYIPEAMTYAVWTGLLPAQIQQVASMAFTGSWTSGTSSNLSYKYSTSNGATATAVVNGTTVYVQQIGWASFASDYTLTIDGVPVRTASGVTYSTDGLSITFRFSGLSSGSHTVVMTSTA